MMGMFYDEKELWLMTIANLNIFHYAKEGKIHFLTYYNCADSR